MIRIQLPAKEVEHLEAVLRATTDPKLRTRVQIVLMAHRGRPHGQIACEHRHLPQHRPTLAQRLPGAGPRGPASRANPIPS